MRILRLCFCLLIAGTVFILGGCKKPARTPQDHDVSINNCMVNRKRVDVYEVDRVRWLGDQQHDYTIRFKDLEEPIPKFTVKHGVPDTPHPIKGKRGCDPDPSGGVYCKYSVTRDNESKPCADFDDPGIHIQ